MYFIFVALVAGVFTAFTPCVLPILPIVLAGKNRYKIILALCSSIIIFTLLLKYSTVFIDVQPQSLKVFSGSLIILVALFMFYPLMWLKMVSKLKIKKVSKAFNLNKIKSDYVLGLALGPIFSSCSPTYFVILATVLPINFTLGFIYLLVYCLGLAFSLYVISIFGEIILQKINKNSKLENMTTKIIAVLLLLTGLAIVFGYDTYLQVKTPSSKTLERVEGALLNKTINPSLGEGAQGAEGVKKEMKTEIKAPIEIKKTMQENIKIENTKINLQNQINSISGKTFAPELSGITGYLNGAEGATLSGALSKNKVVIVYFWTFGCINCQRSLPSLNALYAKYKDQGLEVIGVHTPEFAFEKKPENVKEAIAKLGIKFPVVLDNDFSTWKSYDNSYWPRKYIIIPSGEIIYDHAGEGAYAEIESIVEKIINK